MPHRIQASTPTVKRATTSVKRGQCFFKPDSFVLSMELHGFYDASKDAYTAVVYLRITYESGHPSLSLIAVKTKVSPLKQQSIPRLELCGAHLFSKVLTSVRIALSLELSSVFAWSDSTIVLYWLDGSSKPLLETV